MRSRLETPLTREHRPPTFRAECFDPVNVLSVWRELLAQRNNLVLRKKRLEAVSERGTKIIVYQQLQAASFFSKSIASFTSIGDTL